MLKPRAFILAPLGALASVLAIACHASPEASPPPLSLAIPAPSERPPPAIASSPPEPSPAPPLPGDVAAVAAFLDGLSPCTELKGAIEVETALGSPASDARRAVRGRLVPSGGVCSLVACDEACCNGCGGAWLLQSPSGAKSVTMEGPDGKSLEWSVWDCHLQAMRARVGAGKDVVVTGTLKRSTHPWAAMELAQAEVCALGTPR